MLNAPVSSFFQRAGGLLLVLSYCAVVSGQSSMQRAIDALAAAPQMRHASLGVCVIDVKSGKVIASHQPDLSLTPASTLKLVTTASALAILGADFRYSTVLEYDGTLSGGKLQGNLYLRGSGDPTLGSDQLDAALSLTPLMERFRLAVQQSGIRRIEGYIIGDDSYLPSAVNGASWQWNDLGNYYAAGAWGLNMHENLYYLRFRQASSLAATPAIAAIEPDVPGLSFTNEVTSAGARTGDNAYIFGAPYTYERFVRGTIPVGSGLFSIKGSIPHPPLFSAQQLAMHLERVGIIAAKGAAAIRLLPSGEAPKGARQVLLTHQSPPLAEIVVRANRNSVNLYCESLLRSIGKRRKDDGSLDKSLAAVAELWEQRGLRLDGVHLRDGSGLSARNAVTTRFLAGLLRKAGLDARVSEPLYQSLTKYQADGGGELRAKSGSIDRVRAYAGYARNAADRLVAFAVIANNYSGSGSAMRRELQQLMRTFCR